MDKYFKAAIQNIATFGDTDVFPFPIERHIFFDEVDETLDLLKKIHSEFNEFLNNYPPICENHLAVVGYAGFRWATQIDPVWNAYLLGLVISIGDEVEKQRMPLQDQRVFSYRFHYDDNDKTVFDPNIGWVEFQQTSVDRARNSSHVLICDIADFYPRVYHHRLENALKKATNNTETVRRIMALLKEISKGYSFGLPIGGPAARLLSELLLNRMDRLLVTHGISFCRYVDDYHIFAPSREEAYACLVFLSEKLLENEGLSLQKSKTRIMTSEEFLALSEFVDSKEPADQSEAEARSFLSIRIRFDPYSPTAAEDYEELKREINRFDVVGMLAREIGKSRIHQALTKRLISAVRYLAPPIRDEAVRSLLDSLSTLYPVFPNVMLLVKAVSPELGDSVRSYAFEKIRGLIGSGSYIIKVPVNLCYAIRVLADDPSLQTDELLDRVYRETTSMIVRRDIILIMAKRDADYWISDIRRSFHSLTSWERRSLLIASYTLGDEGSHWREQIREQLSPFDDLCRRWAAEKKNRQQWSIPI